MYLRLRTFILLSTALFCFVLSSATSVQAQNNTYIQQQRILQGQRATQQALQAQRNAAQARIRQQEQARIQREQQRVQREQLRIQREQQRVQRQLQRAQREQMLKQRELQRAQREQQRAERATLQASRAQQQARRAQQQRNDATQQRQETEARTAILTRQQTTTIRSRLAALPKPANQNSRSTGSGSGVPPNQRAIGANDNIKFNLKKIGPLRDPAIIPKAGEARLIGFSEGLMTARASKFSGVKLGTYGDRSAKYIWTIDQRGVNIVKELSNQITYKHTNLSRKAAIGGEVWFKDSKTVVINSGSGRFGDGNVQVGKSTYMAAVKAWEALGYKVEAKPFRERY